MKHKPKLHTVIEGNGLVHSWVAWKAGTILGRPIHTTLFSKFVNGKREPNKDQKSAIAKALKCRVGDIF